MFSWYYLLMEFITFCISVAALIIAFNARSRSKMLENYLRDLRDRGMTLSPSAQVQPAATGQQVQPARPAQATLQQQPSQQTTLEVRPKYNPISQWFKDDWLLKVGAILLLLGFGWFVSYAIANNWIGPMGRITMGLLAGAALMVVGFMRYRSHPHQADIFLVLGAGVTIMTTFAARSLYGYFTPLSALALMVVVSAFVAGASIIYTRRPLATISLILIGIAPFLTASPTNDILGLFMYFGVLLVAAAILSSLKDYPELNITAALFLWFYSMFALGQGGTVRDTAFLIECFYGVVLFALQLVTAVKTRGIRKIDTAAMLINSTLLLTWISTVFTRDAYITPLFAWAALFIGGTYALFVLRTKSFTPEKGEYDGESAAVLAHGMILLLAIFAMVTPVWQSLSLAGWALLFVIAAYSAFVMTEKREGFYLYAAMAVVYIGAATAAELDGNALTIAYALEASAVTILAFLFTKDIAAARKASFLFAIPVFLSLVTIGNPFSNSALAVMLIIGSILVGTGLYFRDLALATNSVLNRQWYATLIVVGALYFLVAIWRVCTEMVFYGSFGVMVALIIYTLLGIGAYVLGTHRDIKVYRLFGTWLVGFVLVRLAFIDVWALPSGVRIITFMVIGALMVSTAFIIRKKK